MDEVKFLSDEAKKLFEWVAKRCQSRRAGPVPFEEARRQLGISDDRTLKATLEELRQYPHLNTDPVITDVRYGGPIPDPWFSFNINAHRAWAEYRELERKHLCPECRRPALEDVHIVVKRCRECGHEQPVSR